MSRRLGIPLTLSIVFMEIGWRIGVPFEGRWGFPGISWCGSPASRATCCRPHDHGASLHEEDCRRMIQLTTAAPALRPSMIRSLGKRDMIARLLFNLKVGALKANDTRGALSAVERLLLLHPNDPPELRDRGPAALPDGPYRDARSSLGPYLPPRPDALDREASSATVALDMMAGVSHRST